jgi:N-acetyl-gamma-glutamyl-phosphate reductase
VLREFYGGAQWIRIFEHGKLPQIQYSVRTNYCDVGFQLAPDGKRLIVVSCLDNLMKGAAGQALQNLNVMFGWSEKEGF